MPLTRRDVLRLASATTVAAVAGTHRLDAAVQGTDPLGIRRDFPVTANTLYLDTAYIGAVPRQVANAGSVFAQSKAGRPISLGEMLAKTDEVRAQFARLINASPDEVGFLSATSEGENLVAGALDLKPGDNIVIDELHYMAEFVLYRKLEASRGIELRIAKADQGAVTTAAFEPLVDNKTRLVSVSFVSNQNGYRHDLKALADLAHAHGAWLYTDAIQGVGAVAFDVKASGVDACCSGTYKWLHAGYGVAPFYVRREVLDRIPPDRFGALHVEHTYPDYRYDLYTTAKKFEYATLAFGAVYQLGAALTYLEQIGVLRIEAHVTMLARRLRQGLLDRQLDVLTPEGTRSPIVAFRNPGDPAAARKTVEAAGAQVSFRENGTQIRVSPALFNTVEEIDRFLGIAERLR